VETMQYGIGKTGKETINVIQRFTYSDIGIGRNTLTVLSGYSDKYKLVLSIQATGFFILTFLLLNIF
jgi:hypothetical protein